MSQLVHVPLGKIAKLNPAFDDKATTPRESVDFLPMSAVHAELTSVSATEQRLFQEVQKGYTSFSDGDVLLAKITPCFENGKIAVARLRTNYGFGSTEFHVIRADASRLDCRYLVHFLRRDEIRLDGARKMTGSAGQRRVPKHYLESLPIPLPPVTQQRRIAAILDQADLLRAKRREALAQLDSLTQSIFIEMFGDLTTNPKGWAVTPVRQFIISVTNGLTRRRSDSETGKDIVLRLRDIRSDWIDFSEVNRITLIPSEVSRFSVDSGDLLFIRVNGNPDYVGRCALFQGYSEPVFFNDHIMRVKVDQTRINRSFLSYLLNGSHGKGEIAKYRKTSAGQHTINQEGLGKIQIPTPPIKLQTEFVSRLKIIDRQKNVIGAAQAELDALFNSLQHSAFRGEL